ncbi:MAG: hypothetical protein WCZ43_11705 [Proteiniphilum sp.]
MGIGKCVNQKISESDISKKVIDGRKGGGGWESGKITLSFIILAAISSNNKINAYFCLLIDQVLY